MLGPNAAVNGQSVWGGGGGGATQMATVYTDRMAEVLN